MSSIATQTTNSTIQSLANLNKSQSASGAGFSELVNSTNASNQASSTLASNAVVVAADYIPILNYYSWGVGGTTVCMSVNGLPVNVIAASPFGVVEVQTTSLTSTLLSQTSDSTLPTKAFDTSELTEISPELLEAISKYVLQTQLEAKDGFKTIFFRDAQSLEFTQDTLSEASINSLKAQFGDESFLKREDGSLVLTGQAERFVSGWQKALQGSQESQSTLDTLLQKDKNLDGELSGDELGTQSATLTQSVVTTSYVVAWWVILVPVGAVVLTDLDSLAAGFAFRNLSELSQTWLEENFPQLFSSDESEAKSGENAENSKAQSTDKATNADDTTNSGKVFDRAKFTSLYANFVGGFNLLSASFVGLKGYRASSANFNTLNSVMLDLTKSVLNSANASSQGLNSQNSNSALNSQASNSQSESFQV